MKNVSQRFYFEQFKDHRRPIKKYFIYRKNTNSETWESNPIEVTDTIKKCGKIRNLLDIQSYNLWQKSNFTINARNDNGEWERDGEFFSGYSRYKSKIRIQTGYIFEDGEEEIVDRYTGLITKVEYGSDEKNVTIRVEGLKKLLEEGDAENVGTLKTAQTLVQIDSTTFRTADKQIQKIWNVEDIVAQKEVGIDYNVSNLGQENDYAQIKFNVPPTPPVKADYVKSYSNIYPVDEIIKKIVEEAGFAYGEYFIDNLVLEGETFEEWEQTTQADFDAGEHENIDTSNNSIKMDIDSGTGKYYERGWIISQIFDATDGGSNPFDSWVSMQINPQFPGGEGNFKVYTRTNVDSTDILTEPWVEVGSDGRIMSGNYKYLQWKIEIDNYNTNNTPEIDSVIVFFREDDGNAKKLNFYNFTGMTCSQALEEFLKMGDYEEGFTGIGHYYFRRRKTMLSAMTLTDDNALISINDYDLGIDRIINRITANYGEYRMVRESTTGSPSSQEKYGKRTYDFESQLLISGDGKLVREIIDNILALRDEPRETVRFKASYLPSLEMGDLNWYQFLTRLDLKGRVVGIEEDIEN